MTSPSFTCRGYGLHAPWIEVPSIGAQATVRADVRRIAHRFGAVRFVGIVRTDVPDFLIWRFSR